VPVLKPVRGIRLNKSHPLARGLVGYWLFNEGSGNKVFDLSGNGHGGTLNGNLSWTSGNFASAIQGTGTDGDYISGGDYSLLDFGSSIDFSVGAWIKTTSSNRGDIMGKGDAQDSGDHKHWEIYVRDAGQFAVWIDDGTNTAGSPVDGAVVNDGKWHFVMVTCSRVGNLIRYVDGVQSGATVVASGVGDISSSDMFAIFRRGNKTTGARFGGLIDHVPIYNRILSASEIAQLYREPFCMFAEAMRPKLIGGQIVNLAGSSVALSSLSATAKAMRKVGGNVVSTTDVTAILNLIRSLLYIESNWKREALFNGMTANAFKLGTILSLGWFWVRVAGCSVLYRGSSMGEIDFVNILAVAEQDACEISPPNYISHDGGGPGGSTYFYVVRRFNNNGYQEHTLAAAVKVSISSSGELAEPQPNNISSSKVEQVASNKIRLAWFYCPLEQKSQPVSFNVYYDDRTGQIDYQNPLATIGYKGRKFYSFQSSALEAGKYLFAIRAEDAGGIENISLARLKIQLDTLNPDAIDILRAEAV